MKKNLLLKEQQIITYAHECILAHFTEIAVDTIEFVTVKCSTIMSHFSAMRVSLRETTCLFCNFETKSYFTMYDVPYAPLLCVPRLSPSLAFSICPVI